MAVVVVGLLLVLLVLLVAGHNSQDRCYVIKTKADGHQHPVAFDNPACKGEKRLFVRPFHPSIHSSRLHSEGLYLF